MGVSERLTSRIRTKVEAQDNGDEWSPNGSASPKNPTWEKEELSRVSFGALAAAAQSLNSSTFVPSSSGTGFSSTFPRQSYPRSQANTDDDNTSRYQAASFKRRRISDQPNAVSDRHELDKNSGKGKNSNVRKGGEHGFEVRQKGSKDDNNRRVIGDGRGDIHGRDERRTVRGQDNSNEIYRKEKTALRDGIGKNEDVSSDDEDGDGGDDDDEEAGKPRSKHKPMEQKTSRAVTRRRQVVSVTSDTRRPQARDPRFGFAPPPIPATSESYVANNNTSASQLSDRKHDDAFFTGSIQQKNEGPTLIPPAAAFVAAASASAAPPIPSGTAGSDTAAIMDSSDADTSIKTGADGGGVNNRPIKRDSRYDFLKEYVADEITTFKEVAAATTAQSRGGRKGPRAGRERGQDHTKEESQKVLEVIENRHRAAQALLRRQDVKLSHTYSERQALKYGTKNAPYFLKRSEIRDRLHTGRKEKSSEPDLSFGQLGIGGPRKGPKKKGMSRPPLRRI